MPRIDLYQDNETFVQINLDRRIIRLGRGEECDVTLTDPGVSRLHAEIEFDGDRYILHDRSKNGTRVNASMVKGSRELEFGDRVYIGSHVLIIQADSVEPVNLSHRRTTSINSISGKDY